MLGRHRRTPEPRNHPGHGGHTTEEHRPSCLDRNVPSRRSAGLMASLQFPSDVLVFSCYNAWALLKPSEEGAMRYVFGNYTLDTLCYELRRAGTPVPLRPKVFHLLAYLLAHRDRIVPRQELCEHLWPHQFVSDATLDACLAQARQAVGDRGRTQRVIQTRHGYGYRFVAAVSVHDGPAGEDDRRPTPPTPQKFAEVEP